MPAIPRAGEHSGAAGFDRHHDQRLPLDDAGVRRGGRQQHVGQRRARSTCMNIKRLAYTVRKPEEAFEMPLDYDKAPYGPAATAVGVPARSIARRWSRRWSAIWPRAGSRCSAAPAPPREARAGARRPRRPQASVNAIHCGQRRRGSGGPLPLGRGTRRGAFAESGRLQLTDRPWREHASSFACRLRRPSRWILCARPTCARPSKNSARSISGRRRSSRLPPATWPIPLIFWCWRKAEAIKQVDLNLDTLKQEILDYLESHGLAIFRNSPGTPGRQPDGAVG